MVALTGLVGLAGLYHRAIDLVPSFADFDSANLPMVFSESASPIPKVATAAKIIAAKARSSPYGTFPQPNDPFQFLPCTNTTSPPDLKDADPTKSWAALFDPDPTHWSWTNRTANSTLPPPPAEDPYFGRGVFLCGYLDVPLDASNTSEKRIFRLAVTKLQVSGLARTGTTYPSRTDGKPNPGVKTNRTIIIEPGGPGSSGTAYAWRAGNDISKRLSNGTFDVLGWDPRGVNATQPAIACYPYNADRDRWSMLSGVYRAAAGPSAKSQLALADAMFDATFRACRERTGDLARFIGTGAVARDLDRIRAALGEDDVTGYLVSYGTGIGQTYAGMFPDRVGRMVLDGTEYVRDHRELGGFGWTALDNATDAWRDGVLGECLAAGPDRCELAKPAPGLNLNANAIHRAEANQTVTLEELQHRMDTLLTGLIARPLPAYTNKSGPSLITYSAVVGNIYAALYNAKSWPQLARMLYQLEAGNTTLAGLMLEKSGWQYDPSLPVLPQARKKPSTDELTYLVICADSYDATAPPGHDASGLDWWDGLWANMTAKSWISGDSRLFSVLPCRHYSKYWPQPPVDVFRGDLNKTLKTPVLLIAEAYDPATPLRNGRRLAREMGGNSRLVAHHGYGHSSRDTSKCTDGIARRFVMEGVVPEGAETECWADERPYAYKSAEINSKQKNRKGTGTDGNGGQGDGGDEDERAVEDWRMHMREVAMWNPSLMRRL